MSLEDIDRIKDVILLFDQVLGNDDTCGEKDFFEFIKRLNRDLTPKQRHAILTITIDTLRGINYAR